MLRRLLEYRVSYADTDRMGFVYYANYLVLFERIRTELLRQAGLSYRALEESGTGMPVLEAHVRYRLPARYDDVLSLYGGVRSLEGLRLTVDCEVRREERLLASGWTVLTFTDLSTGHVRRPPAGLTALLSGLSGEGGA